MKSMSKILRDGISLALYLSLSQLFSIIGALLSIERFKGKRNQFLSGSTSTTGMGFLVVIVAVHTAMNAENSHTAADVVP